MRSPRQAGHLGKNSQPQETAELLGKTLSDDQAADEKLAEIASELNFVAADSGGKRTTGSPRHSASYRTSLLRRAARSLRYVSADGDQDEKL